MQGASQVAAVVKSLPETQETQEVWVLARGWEDPLEEDMATHCTVLACRIRGQRSLVGDAPQGCPESRHD